MRDGIAIAQKGIPSVALVTEKFWPQGDFVAKSLGMPDAPRLRLPHPLAGTGEAHLEQVAEALAPAIVQALAAASDRQSDA